MPCWLPACHAGCLRARWICCFAPPLPRQLKGIWAVDLLLWELQFIIAECSLNPLLIHSCVSEGVATCLKRPPTEKWTKVACSVLMGHAGLALIVKPLLGAGGAGNQKRRNPNCFNFPPIFLNEFNSKHSSYCLSSPSSIRKYSGSYVDIWTPGTFRMAKVGAQSMCGMSRVQ